MYFEAEILIDPSDVTALHVTSSRGLRWLARGLWGSWRSNLSEQQMKVGTALLHHLRQGLLDAGIDDVVVLSRDGTVAYVDERGREDDLDHALAQAEPPRQGFDELRMVLQDRDDAFNYVLDVHLARLYPVDGFPIRMFVHGLWRDLDAREIPLGRGGDLTRGVLDAISTRLLARPCHHGRDDIPAAFVARVTALADCLQRQLPEARIEQFLRSVVVVPRERRTSPSALPKPAREAAAPFLDAPGFEPMRFYAHRWAEQCRHHHVELSQTLFVDESGHPLFRVGADPLKADGCDVLLPGAPLSAMPTADTIVFTGHEREQEVQRASLVPASEELDGVAGRLALRAHELRSLAKPGYRSRLAKRVQKDDEREWVQSVDLRFEAGGGSW